MDRPGSGLRRLIGLLLVLNLGVLAYGFALEYWRGRAEPPLAFNGDKIRLMAEFLPENTARESTSPVVEQAPTAPVETARESRCLVWPELNADSLAQVEAKLAAAGVEADAYDLILAKKLGWWVYLPPLADADALRAALDDIRAKGVTDLAAVRSGSMVNAISLGAFPTLARVRAHAALMAKKGVAGVSYAPRPGAGEVRLTLPNTVSADVLARLAGMWPQDLRPDTCPSE